MAILITLEELRQLAITAKDELERKAFESGRDNIKIYLHWTAGWYGSYFDDYHVNIDEDGSLYAATNEYGDIYNLSDTLSHTWKRNSGSVGLSLCCCVGATTENLGENPPTENQLKAMADCIAVLCDVFMIPINIETVMTHGEAADNADGYWGAYGEEDLYGPQNGYERWDLDILHTGDEPGTGGDTIREMAKKSKYYKEHNFE